MKLLAEVIKLLFSILFPTKEKIEDVHIKPDPIQDEPEVVEPTVIENESEDVIEEDKPEIKDPPKEVEDEFLPANIISKIISVIDVFETSSLIQNYSKISIFNDGPNNIRQITLGRGLTEFGNLAVLVKRYANAGGKYSNQFKEYEDRIGKHPSLVTNANFLRLLEDASEDPVMRREQDLIFAEKYWNPAKTFFINNGFAEALSMLVIYDSYIHSGSVPSWLRKRFSEKPPAKGGSERNWIEQYVNTRHNWLATHSSRPILRKTIYRTNCFKEQMRNNNWDLTQPINANGIIVK